MLMALLAAVCVCVCACVCVCVRERKKERKKESFYVCRVCVCVCVCVSGCAPHLGVREHDVTGLWTHLLYREPVLRRRHFSPPARRTCSESRVERDPELQG